MSSADDAPNKGIAGELLPSQPSPDSQREYVINLIPSTESNTDSIEVQSTGYPGTSQPAHPARPTNPQTSSQARCPDASVVTQKSPSSLIPSRDGRAFADISYGSRDLLSPWFPQIDKTFTNWRSRRHVVLWSAFTIIFLVFITNLTLTILSYTVLSNDIPDKYLRNLYTGECETVRISSVLIHLAINILSSLMLSASNLSLQLVSAPTKDDIVAAHKNEKWLDIGVPSLRNLKSIPWKRRAIWVILATSSLPIHFLYNSVVVASFTVNSYAYLVVTEDFLSRPFSNATITGSGPDLFSSGSYALNRTYAEKNFVTAIESLVKDNNDYSRDFKKISTFDGLRAYHKQFVWRPNFIAVALHSNVSALLPDAPDCDPPPCNGTANSHGASLLDWGNFDAYSAGGGDLCRQTPVALAVGCSQLREWTDENAKTWTLGRGAWGFQIDYFLVDQRVTEKEKRQRLCHLQCSPVLLLVVTIFNLVKCFCIFGVIFILNKETICTLGDALQYFLEDGDEYTKIYGVVGWEFFTRKQKSGSYQKFTPTTQPRRWAKASSKTRWFWSILGFSLVIIFAFVVIVQGFLTQNKYYEQVSFSSIWELGFGTARHEEIISWNQSRNGSFGFFANIMVANVWQVLVSMLYLIFNAILSCQLLAAEWGQYGYERKTLRVSHPKGIQRGSYFISMPLRYGLPIIALFAILHWLISQSAFVIRVLQFDINGTPVPGFTMAGFSIMPCITALTLGILCLAGYLTTSLCRKYTYVPGMPFVSTCSLAISANCHRAALDKDVHLLPLQWGVYEVAGDPENVAKCAFTTSIHVRAPDVDDVLYGIPTEPAVPAKDDRRTTRPKRFARYWTDFWGESMTRLRRQKHE